jgi:hypothetical protein
MPLTYPGEKATVTFFMKLRQSILEMLINQVTFKGSDCGDCKSFSEVSAVLMTDDLDNRDIKHL